MEKMRNTTSWSSELKALPSDDTMLQSAARAQAEPLEGQSGLGPLGLHISLSEQYMGVKVINNHANLV
jgi:hypothetical protein